MALKRSGYMQELELRLMRKNATGQELTGALEELAEVNHKVLTQIRELYLLAEQTLVTGKAYRAGTIPRQYSELKQSLEEMMDIEEDIENFGDENRGLHLRVLQTLDKKLWPALQELDTLFTQGYHRPAPSTAGTDQLHILTILDEVNYLFHEPFKTVAELLQGRNSPDVEVGSARTVQDLIRVMHQNALKHFKDLIKKISHDKGYNHIPTIVLYEEFGDLNVHGMGLSSREQFEDTPIWPIVVAAREYYRKNNRDKWTDSLVFDIWGLVTPNAVILEYMAKGFGDKPGGSLKVIFDPAGSRFNIEFYYGEKSEIHKDRLDRMMVHFTDRVYNLSGRSKAWKINTWTAQDRGPEVVSYILNSVKDALTYRA